MVVGGLGVQMVALYGGGWALLADGCPLWWWVGSAFRDWNDYQPPGLSYVNYTTLYWSRMIVQILYSLSTHLYRFQAIE